MFLENIDRDDVIARLRSGNVEIDFQKVNGERRVMTCTLQESVLPENAETMQGAESVEKEKPNTALSVWDVDNNGWRAFRWDSIFSISE